MTENSMPKPYSVIWYSPRKFLNQSFYYFGTAEEAGAVHDAFDPYHSIVLHKSGHPPLAEAERAAHRYAARLSSLRVLRQRSVDRRGAYLRIVRIPPGGTVATIVKKTTTTDDTKGANRSARHIDSRRVNE